MQPLISQGLQFTHCSNKREDYEFFLQSLIETDYYKFRSKHFKVNLIDYWKTKQHYEDLITGFEQKFKNCLDANFLIDNELKVFKDFLNEPPYTDNYILEVDFITKTFRRNGFLWVTTGKTILIEDFFLMKDFIYKQKFPLNIEDLQVCWDSAYHDLEQTAKGYAEGLYVQFLKERKMETNNSKPENKNEPISEYEFKSIAQKIIWLHELGILKMVLEKSNHNYYKAANIIQSFTDLKVDTVRKGLEAIFKPNAGNEKNNPLNNPENNLFVSEMVKKFKLDKEKEN